MARVTVEDCVQLVPNRFELVMMAAQRARDIHGGAVLQVPRDADKNTVVALREIAGEAVGLEDLRESLIRGHQRPPEVDEPEDEIVELMAGETGYQGSARPEGEGFGDDLALDMNADDDEDDAEDDASALDGADADDAGEPRGA